MPIKISKKFKAIYWIEKSKEAFNVEVKKSIVEKIKDLIMKGISPVKGRKFQKYSEGYLAAIKRNKGDFMGKPSSPVNLHLKGDLLDSLKAEGGKEKTIIVFRDKKAPWHNDGMGNLPERRILPNREGEDWHLVLKVYIKNALQKALSLYFKK
jgi:hypothetical protein